MAAPSEPHDDPPGKAPSLLLAAIRRWPLLVLGAGVGSLVGFFVFAAQAPQYQSSAKVLVIKQRVEQLSGSDSRAAYVDDYVATQIPLIKSDLILTAAVKRPELSQLSEPLPENPNVAASVLLNGLTILRDKEATAGSYDIRITSAAPETGQRTKEEYKIDSSNTDLFLQCIKFN